MICSSMIKQKDQLINDLYLLLTTERSSDNRFYYNKSVSFGSEHEFSNICKGKNLEILDGGMFLFRRKPEYYAIYVTISSQDKNDYSLFYNQLLKADRKNLRHVYFGQIKEWKEDAPFTVNSGPELKLDISEPKKCPATNPEDRKKQKKEEVRISTPEIEFFEYDGNSWNSITIDKIRAHFDTSSTQVAARKQSFLGYLNKYPEDYLKDLYCNRFFWTIQLAGVSKGMSDIDMIVLNGENYELVEVKNKTPVFDKKYPNDLKHARFGWDFRRIAWYLYLKQKTGLNIQYAVARIDNRIDRNILNWKFMPIDHWCLCAEWGSDMQGNQMAPYTEFSDTFPITQ